MSNLEKAIIDDLLSVDLLCNAGCYYESYTGKKYNNKNCNDTCPVKKAINNLKEALK